MRYYELNEALRHGANSDQMAKLLTNALSTTIEQILQDIAADGIQVIQHLKLDFVARVEQWVVPAIRKYGRKHIGINELTVKFNLPPSNPALGEIASSNTVRLSAKFTSKIGGIVLRKLIDSGDASEIENHCKDQVTRHELLESIITEAIPTIHLLAQTLLHELTHISQRAAQMHRPSIEYRSYLDKTWPSEQDITGKMKAPEDLDDAYRASPQEISAFAASYAAEILQTFDTTPSMEQLRAAIVDKMDDAGFYTFDHNKTRRMVAKRYAREIYKNVMDGLAKRKPPEGGSHSTG